VCRHSRLLFSLLTLVVCCSMLFALIIFELQKSDNNQQKLHKMCTTMSLLLMITMTSVIESTRQSSVIGTHNKAVVIPSFATHNIRYATETLGQR